ncbi:hypothetical protein FH972_020816 [Carpinus fangiana]|uniref:Uncharacterized protein n=1 Tax=Carpinus fangiana TaxID=176857 RepID=A0A5N6RWJ4_9ROSI|nr:hypothetical protein FH972_020816 [Carpinus fangiana]
MALENGRLRLRKRIKADDGSGWSVGVWWSSERSTLWPESMVLVDGGRWVARGRIWWALSVGTRGWRSVDDVAGF